uniref:Uncharacterized protein n=1 Tax=Anopheles coluzzii TaxID=1518534 RepID=A0A8W7PGY4_ANOCL
MKLLRRAELHHITAARIRRYRYDVAVAREAGPGKGVGNLLSRVSIDMWRVRCGRATVPARAGAPPHGTTVSLLPRDVSGRGGATIGALAVRCSDDADGSSTVGRKLSFRSR